MRSADAILGKRVLGLDLKWANRHADGPSSGLFLIFDDGSYYELNTQVGYLEIGKHLPPRRNQSADPRLANYYLAASGRVSEEGEPPLPPRLLRPRSAKPGK